MSEKRVTAKIAREVEDAESRLRPWNRAQVQQEFLDRIDVIIRERDRQVALSVVEECARSLTDTVRKRIESGDWKSP